MKRFLVYLQGFRGTSRRSALLALLVLFPLWLLLGNWYQSSLLGQERLAIGAQVAARANTLVIALNQRLALLQGLYAFTRTEWPGAGFDFPFEVFSSGLYLKSSGLRTLMIAPEGIARYVYPLYDARTLVGYDVLNDPSRETRADIQRAIHTREITLSRPGELPQGGFGLVAWQAVFRGSDLWGLVSISLDLPVILSDSGIAGGDGSLTLALRDATGYSIYGQEDVWQDNPIIQQIALPEGAWELGGTPAGGWIAPLRLRVALFRLGSLLLAVFLAGMIYLVRNRQEQLARVAVLEERQRIARDLHDSLSQVLYSIGLGVRSARAALGRSPDHAESALEYVGRLAESGQVEMRALIFELRPESLQAGGIIAAIERQAAVLCARYQVDVEMDLCPEPQVPLQAKEVLYRVAQEAMHNIVKHSRATRARISLQVIENRLKLEIVDNGVGFDVSAPRPGHLGLKSMRERAARHSGCIQIDSAPGQGTRIELILPA
jgi:signal transduction histidine kinase